MYRREKVLSVLLIVLMQWFFLPAGDLSQALAKQKSKTSQKAQSLKELSAEEVGEEASKLLKRINQSITTLKNYEKRKAKASPEDSLVLQLQISSLQQRTMDNVQKLADTLLEREKTGPQVKLRKQVEYIYKSILPRAWIHINGLRSQIDEVRARRQAEGAGDLLLIENQIAKLTNRLDTTYEISFNHIEKMKQLKMDVKKAESEFAGLLADRIEELSGRMELALERIDYYESRRKETPDDANIVTLLIAANKSLETNTGSMKVVLGLMESLKIDVADYRARLVEKTSKIDIGALDTGVATSLASRAFGRVTDWLIESGPGMLFKLLVFAAIIFLFRFAKRIVHAALEKTLDASKIDLSELARRMLITTVSNLVMIIGILLALAQLGISLGPLLAGLGIAGFVVGFALQETLGNFAAGVMILIYRPYDVGDLIDVGGVFGKVDKMSLVSTSILTVDNQSIVIPNNKIWGDVIKNVTAQNIRRVDMVFGIGYEDDIPKAESILEDILKSHDKVLEDPEPVVRLHTLNDSSVDFIVRPWAKADDYWDVYWDITRTVKLRFDEEGVSIPFPQRDLHIYNESAAPEGAK